jgi:CheY-like chemotaxis protein
MIMRSHLTLAQQLESSYRDKQIISTANKENDSPVSVLNQTSVNDKIEVLIVEDNLVNIKIIKNFISSLPYNVTLANDGLDAVMIVNQQILKNPNKPPFDIIFMDQNMPRLAGDLAIKRISGFVAKKGLKRIPIISISDVQLNPEEQQARGVDE